MIKLAAFLFSFPLFLECIIPETSTPLTEICDNGIDDDNDGSIDLNDSDCNCHGISDTIRISSSIIPNASFEDYTVCPYYYSQMEFCKGWIQASIGTSDYYNTCGLMGSTVTGYPPLPLPSGNGYVGFLDTRNLNKGVYQSSKEYVGSCLNRPLLAGKEYTLSFWIGFGIGGPKYKSRDTFNLGVFATDGCKNLPFQQPDRHSECPLIDKRWYLSNKVSVAGKNEWKKVIVKILPTKNIKAIIIGPACEMTDGEYYIWMDELLLDESINFEPLSILTKVNPCSEDSIILTASKSLFGNFKYQWYKDGVAISGANKISYTIPKGMSGAYVLKLNYGSECELSKPYYYTYIEKNTLIDTTICKGSTVEIANKSYSDSGIYFDTLKNHNGCDSILEINIKDHPRHLQTIKVDICENTAFEFDGRMLDSTAVYSFNYSTINGCDSTVLVDLNVRKKDYKEINFEICEGDKVRIANKFYTQSGQYLDTLSNNFGCDSVLEIHIVQRSIYSANLDSVICEGSYVEIGTNRYDTTGIYHDSLKTTYLCDSVIHLTLKVNKVSETIIDSVICEGDFVEIFGIKYYSSGSYSLVGQNQFACDSLVNVNIKTEATHKTYIDTSICSGSSIEVLNQSYTSTTHEVIHTLNQYHCDSSIFLNLLVNPVYNYTIKEVICEGSWIKVGNQNYDKTGLYTIALKSSMNCDSIIQLELKTNPNSTFELDTTICFQQQLIYGNKILTQPGNYHFVDMNEYGCDSITDIQLLINSEINSKDSVRQLNCENDQYGEIIPNIFGGQAPYTYRWNNGSFADHLKGLSYGNYTLTVTDQNQCTVIKSFNIDQVPCFCFDVNAVNGSCLEGGLGVIQIKQLSGRNPLEYFLNSKPYPVVGDEIPLLKPGQYLLEIVDEKNCVYSHPINIQLDDNFIQDLGTDTLFHNVGDSVELTVNLPGQLSNLNGTWSGSDFIACPNCIQTKTFAKLGESEFTFSGEDVNGCPLEYKIIVVAKRGFFIPDAFSPNYDQSNDYFNLISDSSVEIIDVLQIYDRWGNRIFESKAGIPNTPLGAWDGSAHGRKVDPGVFIYLFQFRDKTGTKFQLTGEVTLIR